MKIDYTLFSTLDSYYIDEDNPHGPQLLIKSNKKLMPLLVMSIPKENIDDIETILKEKLQEEELNESLLIKVLELLGV